MTKYNALSIFILFLLSSFNVFAQRMDSIAIKHDKKPLFLTVNLTEGGILPTEDFISHSGKMP